MNECSEPSSENSSRTDTPNAEVLISLLSCKPRKGALVNLKISGVGAVGKAKGRDVGGCSEKQGENFQILILVVSFTKKHFVRDKKVSYIALFQSTLF